MLKVNGISITFNPGTVNEKKALDTLSLHVKPGDFISIIGANGAGKSTLFNAISGTFYTDEGTISLDGKDITLMPEHKRAVPGSHAGNRSGHQHHGEYGPGGRKRRMALHPVQ